MKKHVDENHVLIEKKLRMKWTVQWKEVRKDNQQKKMFTMFGNAISNSFGVKDPFKKDDLQ